MWRLWSRSSLSLRGHPSSGSRPPGPMLHSPSWGDPDRSLSEPEPPKPQNKGKTSHPPHLGAQGSESQLQLCRHRGPSQARHLAHDVRGSGPSASQEGWARAPSPRGWGTDSASQPRRTPGVVHTLRTHCPRSSWTGAPGHTPPVSLHFVRACGSPCGRHSSPTRDLTLGDTQPWAQTSCPSAHRPHPREAGAPLGLGRSEDLAALTTCAPGRGLPGSSRPGAPCPAPCPQQPSAQHPTANPASHCASARLLQGQA